MINDRNKMILWRHGRSETDGHLHDSLQTII